MQENDVPTPHEKSVIIRNLALATGSVAVIGAVEMARRTAHRHKLQREAVVRDQVVTFREATKILRVQRYSGRRQEHVNLVAGLVLLHGGLKRADLIDLLGEKDIKPRKAGELVSDLTIAKEPLLVELVNDAGEELLTASAALQWAGTEGIQEHEMLRVTIESSATNDNS